MSLASLALYIASVVGLVSLLLGIGAILKPQLMSRHFGIGASGLALPYVVTTGIRDVYIGLTIFLLVYFKNLTALGVIHLFIGLVALFDFSMVWKHGERKASAVHLGSAFVVIVYGLWLLSR